MALSYDSPYGLIVTTANFLFLGCFVTKKNSYSTLTLWLTEMSQNLQRCSLQCSHKYSHKLFNQLYTVECAPLNWIVKLVVFLGA